MLKLFRLMLKPYRGHITIVLVLALAQSIGFLLLPRLMSDIVDKGIVRGDQRIHLAGIDDAHYYRADNIQKVASSIPHDEISILLSHTPEVYRQAAHAGFQVMLSGHTHGGQICLPGSIPITLDSSLPRRMGAGPWEYGDMTGYTSVGVGSSIAPVRFNCLPEITLHHLRRKNSLSS